MSKQKRPSLGDVASLKAVAGSRRVAAIPVAEETPPISQVDRPAAPKPPQPSRAETKAITGHFPPDVRQQLKSLAAERDVKVQDLLAEALNDLFVKYGRPEIVPDSRQK